MSDNNFKDSIKYNPENLKQYLNEKMIYLLDEYEKNNSFEVREYLCYLTAAIYLVSRELVPQLDIYLPFRTKADSSFMKNIKKEVSKYLSDFDNNDFDTTPLTKDISGIKIILDDINYSRPTTEGSRKILNDKDIQKFSPMYKENPKDISNFEFIEQVQDFLYSSVKNPNNYYRLKTELLKRMIKLTPPEFEESKKYTELYNYFTQINSFSLTIPESEILDLEDLLNQFRSISNDKYHFAILNKLLPIVFSDTLIKNSLKASFKFEKEIKKKNGFHALYYTILTPFGNIEIQAQSNRAHYVATKGSAYHSGIDGKSIDVKNFFELVDPNDEHELSYYLDSLDYISADSLVSPYEVPEFKNEQEKEDFLSSSKGIAYTQSEEYRNMIKHIKIKDKIQILPDSLPKEVYDSDKQINQEKLQKLINSGAIKPIIMDVNDYLMSNALSISPYMNVCSSGHTSTTNAEIHHKKVIGEFAEILRKKDSNTCLRDLLIRRLEELIENDGFIKNTHDKPMSPQMIYSLKIVKEHEEASLKLPKDISRKNITAYAEKLRNKINNKKSDDLDRTS